MYPQFPPGFRFGMSTSAYQIEGGVTGKSPSIWDTFTSGGSTIRNGQDGSVAIDHYHRFAEDVSLIADAGVQDYRFSFSWTRVLSGDIGFYDRLVDTIVSAGLRPVPTLYHWDLPQELEDAGGWMNRDTAHRLADYTSTLVLRLGDRVRDWITMNEMNVHTLYGYALADHAPARGLGLGALPAGHHQLLAHGLAVQVLRTHGARRVGSPASTSRSRRPPTRRRTSRRRRSSPNSPTGPSPTRSCSVTIPAS